MFYLSSCDEAMPADKSPSVLTGTSLWTRQFLLLFNHTEPQHAGYQGTEAPVFTSPQISRSVLAPNEGRTSAARLGLLDCPRSLGVSLACMPPGRFPVGATSFTIYRSRPCPDGRAAYPCCLCCHVLVLGGWPPR